MKTCSACQRDRPLTEFHRNRTQRDGLAGECKACKNAQRAERHRKNPEIRRRTNRIYVSSDAWRNERLKREYGITLDDYERMLSEQGGACAICGALPGARRLAVDHCHKTGVVRGLLCTSCNVGIGNLADDPELLRSAIRYLEG